MIKVKLHELKIGDVIAEHILNYEGQVLLSAGTVLTQKAINLLDLWDITEIRLREEKDTDDDIRLSIQFDEIVKNNSQLFNKIEKQSENVPPAQPPIVLHSIINEKSSHQYDAIVYNFSQILSDIQKCKNNDTLAVMSNIIYKYVEATPAVIGYTLKREATNVRQENLINHSISVAIIATKIAMLLGHPEDAVKTITLGSLIHDIGKMELPDKILNKKDCTCVEDEKVYQSHVQKGYDLIKSLGFPREANLILLHHHEYNDASGFPLQLPATKIHPYAQIVAFADIFDTVVNEKNEIPNFFDIRSKLIDITINKINSSIIDAFDRYLEDFIFNVNVQLSDGRTAEVIYKHPFYKSLVVRTTDGQFIDLNKSKDISIIGSAL